MAPSLYCVSCFFFFNDTATTEIYTLSLHDALPISQAQHGLVVAQRPTGEARDAGREHAVRGRQRHRRERSRSEEHTSELQSRQYLVCRLLLEKKKSRNTYRQAVGSIPDVAAAAM